MFSGASPQRLWSFVGPEASVRPTFLLVALLMVLLPLAAAQVDVTGTVGSTTDVDLGEADPNLAGLAGHAQYQVTWFSGATLYARDVPVSDAKKVCAVPDGQSTPVGQSLTATATTYSFTDPNSNAWTTTKHTYGSSLEAYCVPVAATASDATIGTYNFALLVDTDDLGTTALDLYLV